MARRTPAEPEAAAQVQGRCRPRGGHPLLGAFFFGNFLFGGPSENRTRDSSMPWTRVTTIP